MKKITSMKNVFFAIAAMLAGTAVSSAPAEARLAATTKFETIQLKNVPVGKALSVFYVTARESALGSVGQTLRIRSIKRGPVRIETGASRELRIPSVEVTTIGFDIPNYVVIAVHAADQESFYLRNSDGSLPDDPRIRDTDQETLREEYFQHDKLHFISTIKLNRIKQLQPPRDFVEIELDRDL